MSDAILKATAAGAILCDASLAAQVDDDWFDPRHWQGQRGANATAGGRGAAWVVATPAGAGVLRHYRRGGAVAAVLGDRYFWRGAEQTRPFREFRLLQQLQHLQLPAPPPLAARYRRHGLFYSADLLMRRIEGAPTLAQVLADGGLDATWMTRIGAAVAAFHRAGVWHADLNAHNVLLSPAQVYLIDFDRGRLRPPQPAWMRQNLERLRRSLLKLGAARAGEAAFDATLWQPLREAHAAALALAHNGRHGDPADTQR